MTTSPMHARKTRLKSHLVSAKARLRQLVTPRHVLLLAAAACSASLLLLTLRTLHSAAAPRVDTADGGAVATTGRSTTDTPPAAVAVHHAEHHHLEQKQQQQQQEEEEKGGCTKQVVPGAVAEALVHYATSSSAAPRRTTEAEARAAARVLSRRAPCNLLVLGLGDDDSGALWAALNHGGRTLFLEPDAERIAAVRAARPAGFDLDAHPVAYQDGADVSLAGEGADLILPLRDSPDCTSPSTAGPLSPDNLEQSPCRLAPRGLPAAFYESEWDVIVVEAPVVPAAVYTAGVAARARRPGAAATDVLVHGVDSTAEETFTRAFLCEAYIKEEAGRLRHFAIPSHRDKEAMPFCPHI